MNVVNPSISQSENGAGYRLHLAIPDDPVNPDTDIVLNPSFLATFLREGRRFAKNHPDPYPDDEALEKARFDVTELANALVENWAQRLNKEHDRNWSVDFWRMLILPWVCEMTQRVYARWRIFEEIAAKNASGTAYIRTLEDVERWAFPNVQTLQKYLFKDETFAWWIDSVVLNARQDERFELQPVEIAPSAMNLAGGPGPAPIAGWRRLKLVIGHTDLIGARYGGILLALYANLLRGRRRPEKMQPPVSPDWPTRFPTSLLSAIDKILKATVPRTYWEDYRELEAVGRAFKYRAGRVRVGTIDYWNDAEKIVAAMAREDGEVFAIAQHGGFYGQMRYNVLATEGEYRYGRFLTWGFDRHDDYDADLVPLPSPMLTRIRDTHRDTNGDMLLVGDPIRFGVTRIAPQPRGVRWLDYCDDMLRYLNGLAPAVISETKFRPYANAETDISDEHIVENFPDVGRVEGNLHARMTRCRLLQLCSPNTTMIIAMAANVPLLAFWRPEFFTLSKSAEPYFDRLRDAGILFETPETAAAKANEVWENPTEWWNSTEIQSARREWNERFARTARLWWAPWVREIWRMSRAA